MYKLYEEDEKVGGGWRGIQKGIREGGLYPIYIGPDDIWIFPHFLPGYMYKRFALRIFLWFQVLFHTCGRE